MKWFTKPPVTETPCPSDILAGLVARRMILSPEQVSIREAGVEYGTRMRIASWSDKKTRIMVECKTGLYDSFASNMYGSLLTFSRNGTPFTPTGSGDLLLRKAMQMCVQHQYEKTKAEAQYIGDMAACDAIEEFMK